MSDLSWTTSWDSIVYIDDDGLTTNNYNITIYFDVATEDGIEQAIAFERIKYFIQEILDNAIILSIDNPHYNWLMQNSKQRLITTVTDPMDLHLAASLFHKFNSIVEDRLVISKIELDSDLASNIKVHMTEEFAQESVSILDHPMITECQKTPWWFRSDAGSADYFTSDEDDAMLYITDISGWEDVELEWDKDNKNAEAKWKPTIIPGGKTLN